MDLRAPTCQLQQSKAGPTVWENVFIFPKCLTIKKSNRGVLPIDSYILHMFSYFMLTPPKNQRAIILQMEKQVQREVRSSQFQVNHSSPGGLSLSHRPEGMRPPHILSAARYSNQVSPPTFQTRGASEKHTLSLTTHILVWQRIVRIPTAKINFP